MAGLEPAVAVLETAAFAAWRHPFDLPDLRRASKGSVRQGWSCVETGQRSLIGFGCNAVE